MNAQRVRLLGCLVDVLTLQQTVRLVEAFIQSGVPHQHAVVNAHKLVLAHRDPHLREILNSCELVNADGMSVVWASKLLGTPLPERVAGIDLFEALLRRSAVREWRVFFLGADDRTLSQCVARCRVLYPTLRIAGYQSGYWDSSDDDVVAAYIKAVSPHIVFAALPSPRKETFFANYRNEMGVPFLMGVGGSFDVFSGKFRRAPLCLQKIGLEWLWRLICEPKRLLGRYFLGNTAFVFLLIAECVRLALSRYSSRRNRCSPSHTPAHKPAPTGRALAQSGPRPAPAVVVPDASAGTHILKRPLK